MDWLSFNLKWQGQKWKIIGKITFHAKSPIKLMYSPHFRVSLRKASSRCWIFLCVTRHSFTRFLWLWLGIYNWIIKRKYETLNFFLIYFTLLHCVWSHLHVSDLRIIYIVFISLDVLKYLWNVPVVVIWILQTYVEFGTKL